MRFVSNVEFISWCGPCKTLSPLLEKVTSDTSLTDGKPFDLVTIDVDKHTDLALQYSVG